MAVRITTFFLSFLLVVFFIARCSMGLLAEWTVTGVGLQTRLCASCKPSRIDAAVADSLESEDLNRYVQRAVAPPRGRLPVVHSPSRPALDPEASRPTRGGEGARQRTSGS